MMFKSLTEIQDNFSTIPNDILDLAADANLDPYAFRILMLIVRQTYGWRTALDEISLSQFEKTGISRHTIIKALRTLEQKEFILSLSIKDDRNQQRKIYFINTKEARQLVAYYGSGSVTYHHLIKYRHQMISSRIDRGVHEMHRGSAPDAQGVVHQMHGGSAPDAHTKEQFKNNIKEQFKLEQKHIPSSGDSVSASAPSDSVFSPSLKTQQPNLANHKNESAAEVSEEHQSQTESKTKEKPPQRCEAPPKASKAPWDEAGFIQFWQQYPKKVSKEDARRAWNKLKPSPELQDTISKALAFQKNTWDDPRYVPHPATWLNGSRWEDELLQTPPITPNSQGQSQQTGYRPFKKERNVTDETIHSFLDMFETRSEAA